MYICFLGFIETLQEIFSGIFDTILSPILTDVLTVIVTFAVDTLKKTFAELFLQLLVVVLKIVDFLEDIFDIFSGYRDVYVDRQPTDLLSAFMSMDKVKMAFLMVTVLAVALAFLFTIIAVGKSISDMTLEGKRPVGKVLGAGVKAAVAFALVPFMVIFFLQLSTILVRSATNALVMQQTDGTPPSMGTIIFLTGSLDAGRTDLAEPSFTDSVRNKYYTGRVSYTDMKQVKKDFDPAKFQIAICAVCTLLMIVILICGIFLFIQRIFDVLLLYIVSPLFVSTMPFDDGASFGKWRDMFVAKLLSGFGVIFTMKLYLMLVPTVAGSRLLMFDDKTLEGYAFINAMLKLFVVIGGAWAAFKSQHLILTILHPEAARAARMSTAMMMGAVMGAAGGAAGLARAVLPGKRRRVFMDHQGSSVLSESRSLGSIKAMEQEAERKSQAFRG